tara:strand:- start:261 stop:512 length:252 start_codon:yes stop_codon:yes gene_type:complete
MKSKKENIKEYPMEMNIYHLRIEDVFSKDEMNSEIIDEWNRQCDNYIGVEEFIGGYEVKKLLMKRFPTVMRDFILQNIESEVV